MRPTYKIHDRMHTIKPFEIAHNGSLGLNLVLSESGRSIPRRLIVGMLFLICVTRSLLAQETNALSKTAQSERVSQPLKHVTAERIQQMPEKELIAWMTYLSKSNAHILNERNILAGEVDRAGLSASRPAPNNSKEFEFDSKVATAWFTTAETAKLADIVLSYQTPTGGWSKAIDYSRGARTEGTHWTSQSGLGWHYCGTLDNRSTTEQIRFLAHVYSAQPQDRFQDGAIRGIQWLLGAQYPNGGWPQVYPLEPGYHEAITLNDNAMLHAIQVLQEVGAGQSPYTWIDAALRNKAVIAATKGIDCLLRAQVVVDGKLSVWCAQHDPISLEPVAARLKEPPSLSGGESAELVKFLFREAPDTPATRKAIDAAIAWFESHAIEGLRQVKNESGKTDYVLDDSSTEIRWARFYDLKTQKPIFAGGQDGVIYSSYGEMAKNNKVGYDYFTTRPRDLLTKELDRWKKRIKSN